MHPYEMKIMEFMKTVGQQSLDTTNMLLKPATKDIEHYLRKMYEDDPNRDFSLRMSSVGRPLCQQQMEKAKADKVEDDWNFPLRMMYGGIIEGLTVSILRHAGIKIDEEQTHVKLEVVIPKPGTPIKVQIPGTLDIVVDGKVWDIKSASPYAFQEKFSSYESMKQDDHFGYMTQLYGYSKARGLPPGGWIVIDKSSGNVKVITVPDDYTEEMAYYLNVIKNNVKVLLSDAKFARCFTDKDETYRKKFTGNKVLESPCVYCKFRYTCWPTLQHLPATNSTAFAPPYKYYTQVEGHENTVSESKGAKAPAIRSQETLGDILEALI